MKLAVLLFMAILLVLLYQFSENGRYRPVGQFSNLVIDTRTGTIHKVEIQEESGTNKP